MADRLEEIRARLAALPFDTTETYDTSCFGFDFLAVEKHVFANAPADLTFLVSELDAAIRERDARPAITAEDAAAFSKPLHLRRGPDSESATKGAAGRRVRAALRAHAAKSKERCA